MLTHSFVSVVFNNKNDYPLGVIKFNARTRLLFFLDSAKANASTHFETDSTDNNHYRRFPINFIDGIVRVEI